MVKEVSARKRIPSFKVPSFKEGYNDVIANDNVEIKPKSHGKIGVIILTVLTVLFVIFILLPISVSVLGSSSGNVALIPVEGIITSDGASYFGSSTISSEDIISFIEEAEEKEQVKVIVLEINSPGGTPVATDEIASAVKKAKKPVIALVREVAASGGYWVASAADEIFANKMSVTGSIGVFSSYLEFSGFMEKYGVGYERLVAGNVKDAGVPYRKLTEDEKKRIQQRLDKLHDIFIKEVAANRNISEKELRKLSDGDVFLGIEALDLGLIDQIGDKTAVEDYIKENYNLTEIAFITYEKTPSFLDIFSSLSSKFSFKIGEGLGSVFFKQENDLMLI